MFLFYFNVLYFVVLFFFSSTLTIINIINFIKWNIYLFIFGSSSSSSLCSGDDELKKTIPLNKAKKI